MLVPPRAPRLAALRHWMMSPTVLMVAATLLGILAVGWFSVLTRPAEAVAAVWWPASGLALGLAIRTPRRHLWLVSLAVSLVLLGVNLAQYPTTTLGIAATLAAGIEVAIGALILRAGGVDEPGLETFSDLGMLLLAVVAAATAYDLTIALTTLATGDPHLAIEQLFSAGPRRAAGMLMVAPLFLRLPSTDRVVRSVHVLLQITVALVVSVLVFVVNGDWPVSFLVIVPPVWGALTLSTRWILVEMLGIAVIASYGSASGFGPFSFPRFGPSLGGTLLQAFELTMVSIVLLISITVHRERAATERLGESERVFRTNFETSLAGMLVVGRDDTGWHVQRYNAAAEAMLPELASGERTLDRLFGAEATEHLTSAAQARRSGQLGLEVQIRDGRQFQMGVVPLDLEAGSGALSLQFLDVSDTVIAREQAARELERASEVQRALSPSELPSRAGWEHGASAVPAREVGGDFYDLRIQGRYAVVFLGDVMGKGVGSGILAAAARTALRSANPGSRPAEAVADSVRIVDEELSRSNAFVTLGYATVDLLTGEVRLVDAGHGLSFAVRDGGTAVERLAGDDLPLGLGTDWVDQRLSLAPGDSLLMVSDGVLEGWGGSVEDVTDAIRQLRADPAVETPQAFAEALCRGNDLTAEPVDDATAVIIHRDTIREGERP